MQQMNRDAWYEASLFRVFMPQPRLFINTWPCNAWIFFLHLGQRTAREHTAQGGQSGNDGLDDEAPETTPLFTLIDGIEIDHSLFSFKG